MINLLDAAVPGIGEEGLMPIEIAFIVIFVLLIIALVIVVVKLIKKNNSKKTVPEVKKTKK